MPKDEDAKEILTKEKIKLDLRARLKNEIRYSFEALAAPLYVLLIFGIMWLSERFEPKVNKLAMIIAIAFLAEGGVLSVISTVYLVRRLRRQLSEKKQCDRGEFDIVLYRLPEEVEAKGYRIKRTRRKSLEEHFIDVHNGQAMMKFSRYGEYWLPRGKNYRWSERYWMSNEGVFNTSIGGDIFYVVIYRHDPSRTPVMAYNTRLFELEDEYGEYNLDEYAFEEMNR